MSRVPHPDIGPPGLGDSIVRDLVSLRVVVVRMGEFIVSLQIVGPDIQGLRLGMAAEIQRRKG